MRWDRVRCCGLVLGDGTGDAGASRRRPGQERDEQGRDRDRYGTMPTYVATPAGDGPWLGAVVLHDLTGRSHDLRHISRLVGWQGAVYGQVAGRCGLARTCLDDAPRTGCRNDPGEPKAGET